ncbi:hypothetical protein Plim_2497 [Planctopirus limnophila DSM 3776]|uniref:Uncharacterized protein n=1 Tax=Planctopirus limnophila (strain ATCC 43296 / DSM 3776 / IFAM 1008 / Mu 290) TaxID=521674 RepID=D5SPU8_PLAL2|nr:hypothetical protein Plim_2497 [Planctopirus limnophila DSM 3776]
MSRLTVLLQQSVKSKSQVRGRDVARHLVLIVAPKHSDVLRIHCDYSSLECRARYGVTTPSVIGECSISEKTHLVIKHCKEQVTNCHRFSFIHLSIATVCKVEFEDSANDGASCGFVDFIPPLP